MTRRYLESGRTARITVAQPDDMLLRFDLTMTLGEWRILANDLNEDEGDARKTLRRMICTMIDGATQAVAQTYSTTGWSGFSPAPPPPSPGNEGGET